MSFWPKKVNASQDNLESITISNPQKVLGGKLAGMYACEVRLPDTEKKQYLIYADNPIETICSASDFAKAYLQSLINRGYKISEIESKEYWKLAKKDPWVILQEKVEAIRNNRNFLQEEKEKILRNMREGFGKIPQMKEYFKRIKEI